MIWTMKRACMASTWQRRENFYVYMATLHSNALLTLILIINNPKTTLLGTYSTSLQILSCENEDKRKEDICGFLFLITNYAFRGVCSVLFGKV